MLDHFGDVGDVTRTNFAKNTFNDPNNSSDEPVSLIVVLSTRKKNNKRGIKKLTQKTPTVLDEQKGGRSGLIMQNMPCNCQLMNSTMKRWCEYQNRSYLALRTFSLENNTMTPRQAVMIQPVIPGPVVKLMLRKARMRRRVVVADTSAMANL